MKKVLLFFAVMMMAITASAKVYEVSFEKSENITIRRGQSKVINGVKITCLDGNINPAPSWEPRLGHMWQGECTENDFQISTENGETITSIEITTEEESKWSMYYGVFGTGWTTITKGAAWTGSATSVNVGGEFEQVIKLTVTVDDAPAHTHNYANAWSKDETNHWHACTGEGECDAPKSGEAAHSYGEVATETAYYTCSVCQYENATRKAEYEAAVKAAADQAAADAVVTKINAIGTVEYTEASKALIDAAREAYDALTDDQKALITNEQSAVLTNAETTYAELKAAAEKAAADQAAATAVVEKINAIGTVAYTEASKALIDAAREAYDALTDDQKALITNEQSAVLTNAKTTYAELKAAADEAAKYAILTVTVAEQGSLGTKVKKGEVTLDVTAEECWTVATLTVNEEDKLADLADGKLIFDMQDDATVAVTYKWADEENLYTESDISTGIITTKAGVKAYVKDGKIYVESDGAAISIYAINGAKIATKTPEMKTAIFTVPTGTYIVKVGTEGIKLKVELQ